MIQISTVITAGASFLTLVLGAYVALAKYTIGEKEAALAKRDAELSKSIEATSTKQRELELKQIELESEIKHGRENHTRLAGDVREIHEKMLTRTEFDLHRKSMQDSLNQILFELRKHNNPSGQFSAASSNPPKR